MKGYAFLEKGKIGFVEKPIPTCGKKDAIVKLTAIAACSSDVHSVQMGIAPPNLIMGHEGIGIVTEVGEDVRRIKPGDKVIIPAVTPDWSEKEIQYNMHQHSGGQLKGINLSSYEDGLYAEYARIRYADMNLALLPEGMDLKSAVMVTDMMTTGFHGAELADIEFGDTVVVIGIGPVGLMAIAGSKLRGAGKIFGVGTRPKAVELAKEYGATKIISYKEGERVEQVMEITDGNGADRVIIAGGGIDVVNQAVMMVRPGGTVANINMYESMGDIPISCPAWGFGMAHKTIKGGLTPGGRVRMEAMIQLVMAGRVDPSKLVTHEFKGIDKIADAYNLMVEKPKDLIKPIVWLE